MAKPTRFKPFKTTAGWCLNIPPKYSETGKRERQFYSSRDKAEEAAAPLRERAKEFGTMARSIAPSLAEEATSAAALLAPLGISLLEAVRRYVELETRNRSSVTIEVAIQSFRAANEGGEKQQQAYRLRGEKLIAAFPERILSTITGEELHEHLVDTTGGPGAFNQNLRLARAIWRWCAKPPRKWCDEEVVKHLEAKATISSAIGILSPTQVAAVMAAAEKYFPDAVPAFAIALFTGMRQAEIDRLRPSDVTADGITVPAVSAKTKRRRFVHMPSPLAAWLEAYPIGESVTPTDWERKEKCIRRLAGFRVWSDLVARLKLSPKLEATPSDDLPEWPANALRHTAATVAVAMGKPIEQLVFEHGHTGGLEMLRRHYVGAMSKREALAIWSIGPNGTKLSNIVAA